MEKTTKLERWLASLDAVYWHYFNNAAFEVSKLRDQGLPTTDCIWWKFNDLLELQAMLASLCEKDE